MILLVGNFVRIAVSRYGVKSHGWNNKMTILMEEIMECWVAFKNGEYVCGTDEFGYPLHTKDKKKAYKFYDFNLAMSSYFNLGYAIIKEHV